MNRQRLSAILAADGVAFSRLMAQDPETTVRALDAARDAFRTAIAAQGGRLIDTAGDSILAVFETAAGAVAAALEVQEAVELLAKKEAEGRRLRFRIGLHLGDVIEKSDGSVYGDGVNIAARLQGLADPGGIVISDAVRSSVRNLGPLLEGLGEQRVKNIADPVRAFRIVPWASPGGFLPHMRRFYRRLPTPRLSWILPALLIAVVAAIAFDRVTSFVSSSERVALRNPLAEVGRPDTAPLSIVALPFANLTGDPQQAYLADGLTVAITADLGRIRDAVIISASTAFAYKDKAITARQVGKELGVRFVLQGSVQRSGNSLRIQAQLADTTTNAQLWSESFEGTQEDLFALQDQLTTRIGNSIGQAMVIVAARDSEARKRDPTVADLMLRAQAVTLKPESRAKYADQQLLLRKALLIEPDNPVVMARLARALSVEAWNGYVKGPVQREKLYTEARDLALRAKQLGGEDPLIYSTLSDFAIMHGDHAEGVRLAEMALSLDPKRASRYMDLANAYAIAGDPARALEVLKRGLPLSERSVLEYFYTGIGRRYFSMGNDDAAIEWSQKAFDANAGNTAALVTLALAYARKGDRQRSHAAVVEVLKREPQIRPLEGAPYQTREDMPPAARAIFDTQLLPAWRKAGLPE